MKLMCKICSMYGDRNLPPNSDNIIAEIDKSKLRLPLDGSMFKSLNPERGYPDPWGHGVPWDFMWCTKGKHLPWAMAENEISQAIKAGGPAEILTDQGVIKIDENGIVKDEVFRCDICGFEYAHKTSLVRHIKDKH